MQAALSLRCGWRGGQRTGLSHGPCLRRGGRSRRSLSQRRRGSRPLCRCHRSRRHGRTRWSSGDLCNRTSGTISGLSGLSRLCRLRGLALSLGRRSSRRRAANFCRKSGRRGRCCRFRCWSRCFCRFRCRCRCRLCRVVRRGRVGLRRVGGRRLVHGLGRRRGGVRTQKAAADDARGFLAVVRGAVDPLVLALPLDGIAGDVDAPGFHPGGRADHPRASGIDPVDQPLETPLLPAAGKAGRGNIGVENLNLGGAHRGARQVGTQADIGGRGQSRKGSQQQKGAVAPDPHRAFCINGPRARNACAARTMALVLAVNDPFTAPSLS